MTDNQRRYCTTIGIWKPTVELLDQICKSNADFPSRLNRRTRAQELNHLVVQEAVRQGLIDPVD